jgi:hypothetical protein
LTAQWNLLDTFSIAEEFDGSWKVDATAKRKPSQWADREEVGSTGRECSSPDKVGDPSAAAMIPKLVSCLAAAWRNDERQADA